MLTEDTITDTQIRTLRDSTFAPPGQRVSRQMKDLRDLCDCALFRSVCLECENGWWGAWKARSQLAEILNRNDHNDQ